MNSTIKFSRLAAASLLGIALAGCNAVEDVRSDPTFPVPSQLVVVNGSVTGVGLSNTRPIVLEDQGQARCPPPNSPSNYNGALVFCTYTVQGTNVLRFGSLPQGAPYNIVVKTQPFGRVCTVTNGTGVATTEVSNVTLNCVRDATTLYTVTANIAPAIANALPPGFKVSLITEEGTETITPTAGQLQVVFTKPVFNSGSSLPVFAYNVTATTQAAGGAENNCAVTGATNVAAAGTVAPSANVTVNVTACQFTIGGTVLYSQQPQTAYTVAQTITGLELALRPNGTSDLLDTQAIAAFTPPVPASGAPTGSAAFTFPARPSNSTALYEVVVKTQPTGMFCTVSNGGVATLQTLPLWISGSTTTPATQPANITNVTVRCRNTPALASQLTGTYQLVGQRSTLTSAGTTGLTNMGTLDARGFGTSTIAGITATSAGTAGTATVVSDDRKFLTFFANGTFLYGIHSSATSTSTNGVEGGFYSYDNVNQRIYFTITTDSNNNTTSTANSILSGLSSTPGQCAFAATGAVPPLTCPTATAPVMTAVVKTAGTRPTLTATFGSGTQGVFNVNRMDWAMRQPPQTAGEIEGAWVTADSKRVWVFQKSTFAPGMHFGVNGAPNMQDACFQIEDPTLASSFYTRRGGDAGCNPGGVVQLDSSGNPVRDANNAVVVVGGAVGTVDIPASIGTPTSSANSSLAIPNILPGFLGRMPGSLSTGATSPVSPTYYTVVPGTPDTLTVQETLNDTPIRAPVVFTRSAIN